MKVIYRKVRDKEDTTTQNPKKAQITRSAKNPKKCTKDTSLKEKLIVIDALLGNLLLQERCSHEIVSFFGIMSLHFSLFSCKFSTFKVLFHRPLAAFFVSQLRHENSIQKESQKVRYGSHLRKLFTWHFSRFFGKKSHFQTGEQSNRNLSSFQWPSGHAERESWAHF